MTVAQPQPSIQTTVGLIYGAALEPELWPEAVASAAAYGRSSFGLLTWRTGPAVPRLVVPTAHAESVYAYLEQCYPTDPIRHIYTGPLDTPLFSDMWEPRSEFERSECYLRYARAADIEDRACIVLSKGEAGNGSLMLGRGPREDRFDLRSLRALKDLSPHLRRAIQLSARFRVTQERKASLSAVLDLIGEGVFLLDDSGRVVWMNNEAEKLVARGALGLRHGRMDSPNPVEWGYLSDLLQRAISTGQGRAAESGGVMMLRNPDGTPWATLTAAPVHASGPPNSLSPDPARAVVFVRTVQAAPRVSINILQALYGLSPHEARLATDLALGQKLEALAERYGVRKGTVRAQLLSIFRKTGVRRQVDLIKLLLMVRH